MEHTAEVAGDWQSRFLGDSFQESAALLLNFNSVRFGRNVVLASSDWFPDSEQFLNGGPPENALSPLNFALPPQDAEPPFRDSLTSLVNDLDDYISVQQGEGGALPEVDWIDPFDWGPSSTADLSDWDAGSTTPYEPPFCSHLNDNDNDNDSSTARTPASTPPALTFGAPTPQSQAAGGLSPLAISRNPHPSRQVSPTPQKHTHSYPRRRPIRPAKTHYCSYGCGVSTSTKKDCKRHEKQVHDKPRADGILPLGWYACKCSYKTSRKDVLHRHLRTCKKRPVLDSYMCGCQWTFLDRNQFTQHISTCGAKSPGRPPKRSASKPLPDAGAAE